MRAITVRQPWAWAIVHGGKVVENRNANIAGRHRGLVAIHAALEPDRGAPERWPSGAYFPGAEDKRAAAWRTRGAILGVVDLVDVHPGWVEGTLCSPWAIRYVRHAGQVHLVLANPRPLATPVPAKGRLGLWTLPADVEAAVLAQLGAVA